jgi:hypothetical protein
VRRVSIRLIETLNIMLMVFGGIGVSLGITMDLKEGQQITAPFLNGMAKVKKFERKKGFCLLEVVLKGTNEFKTLRISDEQCDLMLMSTDLSG